MVREHYRDGVESRRYQEKIFRRRRRAKEKLKKKKSRYQHRFERKLIEVFYPSLLTKFKEQGIIDEKYASNRGYISIPAKFSLGENFDQSFVVFKKIMSEYILGRFSVIVDFSACEQSDIATFTFLNVVYKTLIQLGITYNRNRYQQVVKKINFLPSQKDVKTNKYLAAFDYHSLPTWNNAESLYKPLHNMSGKMADRYSENAKPATCARIAEFMQSASEPYGYILVDEARSLIERYASEVLNNAEDHSFRRSEWYVNGIAFKEIQHGVDVIEVNLAIMNFGLSMYEGFEETKIKNSENYGKVEKLYNIHKAKFGYFNQYSRETLFMLYMLNEGISRLKYKDDSRGNGTMSFINAFMMLGDYGDENPHFVPSLNIISGHGVLAFDSKYRPFENGDFQQISLNKAKDIRELPDKRCLITNEGYFPGTILECKIYLNKEHKKSKVDGDS